jgi:hypothetical protein
MQIIRDHTTHYTVHTCIHDAETTKHNVYTIHAVTDLAKVCQAIIVVFEQRDKIAHPGRVVGQEAGGHCVERKRIPQQPSACRSREHARVQFGGGGGALDCDL